MSFAVQHYAPAIEYFSCDCPDLRTAAGTQGHGGRQNLYLIYTHPQAEHREYDFTGEHFIERRSQYFAAGGQRNLPNEIASLLGSSTKTIKTYETRINKIDEF